jgi:hypothetical protein
MRFIQSFVISFSLLLLLAPTASANFSDVPREHPDYTAIMHLSESGVVKGYEDGTFQPVKPVNRVEALKTILMTAGLQATGQVASTGFPDVKVDDWFAPFVVIAQQKQIVSGNANGTFTPARQVIRAEFLKMLLQANGFVADKWKDKLLFADVPADAWFAPYMNYAGASGLLAATADKKLMPEQALTRGEVARILYLMDILRKSNDNAFLSDVASNEMAQIDFYIKANNVAAAKRSSELAVDSSQKALSNLPEDNSVLAVAKLARGYDYIVNAFIAAVSGKLDDAINIANQAITKANEAWEADNSTQPMARHIKDRANELLAQITQLKASQAAQPTTP